MSLFKRYFFVDYENVGIAGLKGLEALGESDSVTIFYSTNAQAMTVDMHLAINSSKADIEFTKAFLCEKNSLDFQLATYLGFLISENDNYFPDEEVFYYIITHDKGFKVLSEYWRAKRSVSVELYADLTLEVTEQEFNAAIAAKTAEKKSPDDDVAKARMQAFNNLESDEKRHILEKLNEVLKVRGKATYVYQHLGTSKRESLKKNLMDKYGPEGGRIYVIVMPIIGKYI